jgi:hypothetical protein
MAGLDIGSQVQEEMYRHGVRQPSSPFIEDVASVAEKTATGIKNIGKGLGDIASDVTMKGLTALGVGAAGASDYFTGTNLMPGIGKEFTKSWGAGANLPASAKPLVNAPLNPTGGLTENTTPARTEADIIKEIQETRTPSLGITLEKPAGWIRNEATGEVINVPKAQGLSPEDKLNQDIDILVEKLNAPQYTDTGKRLSKPRGGLVQEVELRKAQLGLVGHKLASEEANDLRRQHLDQLRIQNEGMLAERKTAREESNLLKKESDFQKKLIAISPPGEMDPETGKAQPNWQVGLLDLMDQGHAPQDMYGYGEAAKSLWDKRESSIVAEFARKGLQYNPTEINKPGTVTYRGRQELIRKIRERQLGKEAVKE